MESLKKKLFYMRPEKREYIKRLGRPSFEVVLKLLSEKRILYDGPNPIASYREKSRAYVVYVPGFPPVLVPYIEREEYIELITIIPDKRLKKYFIEEVANEKKK